jgi:hypothetical protein
MPAVSRPQMVLPFGAAPEESGEWDKRLVAAFANRGMTSGFLPLAEEAALRDPGSPHILMLAATAALLDNEPDRALVFLKRYFKRYLPEAPYHLLYALALGSQNKLILARAVPEKHGLTDQLTASVGWAKAAPEVRLVHPLGVRLCPRGRPRRSPSANRVGKAE